MTPDMLAAVKQGIKEGHAIGTALCRKDSCPIQSAVAIGTAAGELFDTLVVTGARNQEAVELYLYTMCAAFVEAVGKSDYRLQWGRACACGGLRLPLPWGKAGAPVVCVKCDGGGRG